MNLKSWLTLFRIPVVFSAMSNLYAGYLIAGGDFFSWKLLAGLLVSCLVIMAGMALNDVADQKEDAKERPLRPIPSGAISAKAVVRVSVVFMVAAILLAGWAKLSSAVVVILLCYSVYLYNFVIKSGPYGPLGMAACRVLNLILGFSLGIESGLFLFLFKSGTLLTMASLGTYIALVSFLARSETAGAPAGRAASFLSGMLVWNVVWIAVLVSYGPAWSKWIALLVLVVYMTYIMSPFSALLRKADAENTSACVSLMLSAIPCVDVIAMLYNGVSIPTALLGLLFLPLAVFVGKNFYST